MKDLNIAQCIDKENKTLNIPKDQLDFMTSAINDYLALEYLFSKKNLAMMTGGGHFKSMIPLTKEDYAEMDTYVKERATKLISDCIVNAVQKATK